MPNVCTLRRSSHPQICWHFLWHFLLPTVVINVCLFCSQAKQRDITDALAKADNLATQNKSYQEVYAAMAESLSEAWIDLNKQLEYRKMLLDQSINFHESAIVVSGLYTYMIKMCF